MKWKSALGLAAGAMALGGTVAIWNAAAEAQTQAIDMKMGSVTINDAQYESMKWMAAELDKRTNGRIKARVFPAAQLGGIPRQVEGIQLGTQEAFHTPPAFFVGINPAFAAADAPGLFESFEHQHKTLNHPTVREKFLGLADSAGIVGTYIFGAGEVAIATVQPVRKIADFKGLKLRVLATPMERALAAEFGVTGVPMDYSETLAAITNRTIDGARSAIVVMGPSKFYTVTKYITITADAYIPSGLWVSKVWLTKLPADLQKAVFDVTRDATERALQWSIEITRNWEQEWVKQGGEVIRLSEAERKEYFRRALPLGDEHLGKNPRIKEMYDLIKAAAQATRG